MCRVPSLSNRVLVPFPSERYHSSWVDRRTFGCAGPEGTPRRGNRTVWNKCDDRSPILLGFSVFSDRYPLLIPPILHVSPDKRRVTCGPYFDLPTPVGRTYECSRRFRLHSVMTRGPVSFCFYISEFVKI